MQGRRTRGLAVRLNNSRFSLPFEKNVAHPVIFCPRVSGTAADVTASGRPCVWFLWNSSKFSTLIC
jgi:hypothetical protein